MDKQDRSALKQMIRDMLLSLEAEELATAKAHHEAYQHESQLDDREVHDKDDIAASRGNADLAAAFDTPVHTHHAKIDVIENLDFSPKDTVEPGAVVSFGGRNLVVAVSTARFEIGGVTYMGISPQSPIYKAMAGLQAGEEFQFNGQSMVIDDVM